MYKTFLKPAFSDIKKFFLDTFFPISCLVCGREGKFICEDCQAGLTPAQSQYCLVCAKPSPFGLTHKDCAGSLTPDRYVCFYDYRDKDVAAILIGGKYNFLPGAYAELGKILAEKIKTNCGDMQNGCTLVPLPLHRRRLRWRGFNQSEVLCRSLGQELELPVADVLIRKKSTKTQKDLKRKERLKNISDAFILSPLFSKEGVRESSVILVDDVATTGATLLEACKILKRGGAKSVCCLTVAKD